MLRRFIGLCVVLLCCVPFKAQTLAHPGWRGNGIAPQAWWKHASFVRMGDGTTFAEAAHTLDAMAEAGIDSMILPDLQPVADSALPFSERFGTEDDLDALLREASARRMHVLLGMPVARLSAGSGETRFWMSRGIAGFGVGSVSSGDLAVLRGVRSAMTRFPGERILIGRIAPSAMASHADTLRDPIALHLATAADAASATAGGWHAAEVTAWSGVMPSQPGRTALIFDSQLLQEEGGAAKAHAMLNRNAWAARRGRTR